MPSPGARPPTTAGSSRLPRPGDLFDRYRVGALIGRGAFGTVFRAHDLELDRSVALKIFSLSADSEDRLRRFRREAELSRQLVHPNTVRVYGYGVERGEVPFIALEFLDGESVHQRLRRVGPMSVGETRRIAASVARALMEAHSFGIVHRDIKPSNVFLCCFAGTQDFVKVLDFGIAKAPNRDLTAHGWLVGTPAYMAPEQILGQDLSPRADLYSLGLLMVTMLSGFPLYHGETAQVLMAQLAPESPELPDAVAQSSLGAIVRRATLKDPAERYPNAREMLAALERTADEERELDAPPPSAASRRPSRGPSVAPVAYGVAEFRPSRAPSSGPGLDKRWAAAVALALLGVVGAAGALGLALRPTRATARAALAAADPSLAPPLIRMRAAAAGFSIRAERASTESRLDLDFERSDMLGVIRIETLPSQSDARWLEQQAEGDRGRATLQRGRRVLSVWAAPRGKVGFDAKTSGLALVALVQRAD